MTDEKRSQPVISEPNVSTEYTIEPAPNPNPFLDQPPPPESQLSTHPHPPLLPPRDSTNLLPPPQRLSRVPSRDDISSPAHYTRDPSRLIAYLIPFPTPHLTKVDPQTIPPRFLIYTPPPPPLQKPKEGEKEGKVHMVQRKWQEEVRAARTGNEKVASWKGVKGRVTKGIDWAIGKTTTSSLDFVNRIPDGKATPSPRPRSPLPPPLPPAGPSTSTLDLEMEKEQPLPQDTHADDGHYEDETTTATVPLSEMTLLYPSTFTSTPDEIRAEFINTMLRTKSKAQRDSIIATGLLPVAAGIDILATLVWPFGGLLEIDGVWAYASIRGAKTARSVTKRLTSTSKSSSSSEPQIHLSFIPSPSLAILQAYLTSFCTEHSRQLFPYSAAAPTESEVLDAIGWSPSFAAGGQRNWEDEQWELEGVKRDLRETLGKGAKEWVGWCKAFEKNPQKAVKK